MPIFPEIDHLVNYEFFSILVQQNKEKKHTVKKCTKLEEQVLCEFNQKTTYHYNRCLSLLHGTDTVQGYH